MNSSAPSADDHPRPAGWSRRDPRARGEYPVVRLRRGARKRQQLMDRRDRRRWHDRRGGLPNRARSQPMATRARHPSHPRCDGPIWRDGKGHFHGTSGAGLSRMTYSHRFCGGYGFNAGLINAAGTWLHYSAPLSCGTLVLSPNTISLGGTPWVSLLAICVRDSCPGTVESSEFAAMQSVTVWVSDSTTPGLWITGGSATTPGWKRGTLDLTYQAADNTGIAYADVTSGAVVLDAHRAHLQPGLARALPKLRSGGFAINTTRLPDGAQSVLPPGAGRREQLGGDDDSREHRQHGSKRAAGLGTRGRRRMAPSPTRSP